MRKNDLSLPMLPYRLKNHLKMKNLSQREASRRCGLNPRMMNEYISGRRIPSIDALYKICTNLEISADYLMGLNNSVDEAYRQGKTDLLYQIVEIIEDQMKVGRNEDGN